MTGFEVSEATAADVQSLASIEVRSFHPTNSFHKQVFPDTPLLHQWWSDLITASIENRSSHALMASSVDHTASERDGAGLLLLRRFGAEERGGGTFPEVPLTLDHDRDGYAAMIESIVSARERLMMGRPHLVIEYFGVDHSLSGQGIGTQLLQHANLLADREGMDCFVLSNAFSKGFYLRGGYEVAEEIQMSASPLYYIYGLVRKTRPASRPVRADTGQGS